MTVKDLKEKLATLRDDAEVFFLGFDATMPPDNPSLPGDYIEITQTDIIVTAAGNLGFVVDVTEYEDMRTDFTIGSRAATEGIWNADVTTYKKNKYGFLKGEMEET